MPLFNIIGDLGCHSTDTKVLMPNGEIKDYSEIKVGDEVLSIDKNLNLKNSKVLRIFEYNYSGKMYHFHSRRYDFLVTPNHRIIYKRDWKSEYEYIEAQNITSYGNFPDKFCFKGKNRKKINIYKYIKKTRKITTKQHNHFCFESGYKMLKYKKEIKSEELEPLLTDDFLKLMGWYISEGSIFRCQGKITKYVQIRHKKYFNEIKNLLDKMDLKYSIYENSKFVIFHRDLGRYFEQECGSYSYYKKIPDYILELSKKHLLNLFETMFKGDGSAKSQTYYTVSKKLCETFVILCLKLGFHPLIRSRKRDKGGFIRGRKIKSNRLHYEIRVAFKGSSYFHCYDIKKKNKDGEYDRNEKYLDIVNYNSKVWCFETELGNFFTTRNGKIAVSGNSGKTLSLAFLCWNAWFHKRLNIYSNLHLFKVPYAFIDGIDKLNDIRNGYVGFDEMWSFVDSRMSRTKANRLVSNILLRSRKRDLTYVATSQMLEQIDRRIRKVLDFTARPVMNVNETVCKLLIFRSGFPSAHNYMKTIYFLTDMAFQLFDTKEEISEMEEESKEPMRIMFQSNFNRDHGYLCQCEECGTKFFNTFEEADAYSEKYWAGLIKANGGSLPI
jgi:hypothetical protein